MKLLNSAARLRRKQKERPLAGTLFFPFVGLLIRDQNRNFTASCTMRAPCLVVTVPKFGVFTAPVSGLKPRVRLLPLNDHSGWFRKLYALMRYCSFLCSV